MWCVGSDSCRCLAGQVVVEETAHPGCVVFARGLFGKDVQLRVIGKAVVENGQAKPQAESAEQLAVLAGYEVVASIDSARGALALGEIVGADNVVGLLWGSEDLIVNLGGLTSRKCNGALRDVPLYVRSQTLLHAKANGLFAVDGIFLDVANLDGLLGETLDASSSGFDAKGGVHVSQMAVIKEGFRPKPDKLDWALRVVEEAPQRRGSFRHGAQIIDAPVIRLAERMVERAAANVSATS